MNQRIGVLAGILVVQLLLVLAFKFSGSSSADAEQAWLEFDIGSVDQFVISDSAQSVTLSKHDEGWMIEDLPADLSKVEGILGKMAALDAPWPVATSSESAARFEVQENNFQRRVRLLAGTTTVADMLLGTSPGYQRVHARQTDGSEIYSVALSNYELPTTLDGWLDKALLAASTAPSRIEVANVETGQIDILEETAEGWLLNGKAADQDAAATYANRFQSLRVMNLLLDETDYRTVASLRYMVGDEQRELSLRQKGSGDETDYAISTPGGERFVLATYIAEQLLSLDVAQPDLTQP